MARALSESIRANHGALPSWIFQYYMGFASTFQKAGLHGSPSPHSLEAHHAVHDRTLPQKHWGLVARKGGARTYADK